MLALSTPSFLANWFTEIFDLKTVAMVVVLVVLLVFWIQYRKRQM